MKYQAVFNHILYKMYKKRTHWLHTALSRPKPGRPPSFNGKYRRRSIRELQSIASRSQARRLAKKEFKRFQARKKTWQVTGHGLAGKKRRFRAWVRQWLRPRRGKVYVFWFGDRCLYVGRTKGRGYRPVRHFDSDWFGKATRIEVFSIRKRSATPLLECLGIHRFLPEKNKSTAATEAWTPKCPLCRLHRDIRTELRQIFRLR